VLLLLLHQNAYICWHTALLPNGTDVEWSRSGETSAARMVLLLQWIIHSHARAAKQL